MILYRPQDNNQLIQSVTEERLMVTVTLLLHNIYNSFSILYYVLLSYIISYYYYYALHNTCIFILLLQC